MYNCVLLLCCICKVGSYSVSMYACMYVVILFVLATYVLKFKSRLVVVSRAAK